MTTKWFYNKEGQHFGPFSAHQLRVKAGKGEITPDIFIRKGLDGEWFEAKHVRGLFKTENINSSDTSAPSLVETESTNTPAPEPLNYESIKHFVSRNCKNCGAQLKIDSSGLVYKCDYCNTTHELELPDESDPTPASFIEITKRSISQKEDGKAIQILELSLEIATHNSQLDALNINLSDNLSDQEDELEAELAPQNITIQENLDLIKSTSCFIATAAYGSPVAAEINVLRNWRDNYLMEANWGQRFIHFYNRTSPPIAKFISKRPYFRYCIRCILKPLIHLLSKKYSNTR